MTLHTAQEIVRRTEVAMPLGEPLYRKTGQVRLNSPIRGVSGRFKRDWVYSTRKNGTCVVRPFVAPADPRTPLQLDGRERFGKAQGNWKNLSPENRAEWSRWALGHVYRNGDGPRGAQAGYLTYVAVQTYRQGMGKELAQGAPALPPPPPLSGIAQAAPPDEATFAFRVRHGLKNTEGLRLLVELTPATATLRRKPDEGDLAWFTADSPEAFLPLQEDGAVYVLRGARFPVAGGQRYGVRMRLVTEEGVAGAPVTGDFIKAMAPGSMGEAETSGEPLPGESPAEKGALGEGAHGAADQRDAAEWMVSSSRPAPVRSGVIGGGESAGVGFSDLRREETSGGPSRSPAGRGAEFPDRETWICGPGVWPVLRDAPPERRRQLPESGRGREKRGGPCAWFRGGAPDGRS